jgi:outer membrane autotransporter protein
MNAYVSNLAPPGPRSNGAHRRKMTRLAALAASASLAAIASPAYAQCVEDPPSTFTCSGQTDASQVITADDAKVTTNPGFEVDTSNNGNGIALQVTGAGLISFEGSPDLTGAGARFSTTGGSGLSAGELSIFSNGNILANGANALRLDNAGGGDTVAVWVGSITNIAGNGVFTSSAFGAGDLSLIVDDVSARDDGIRVSYDANGSATVTAIGPVLGHTGAGVRITAGDASDDVDLTVGDVTGGTFGIIVDSTGTDIVKVDATGIVTGLSADGIRVSAGVDTLGIDIRATQVSGATSGIMASSLGSGNLSIVATGLVSGASENGIFASSQGPAGDLSVTATDVIGSSGIRTYNSGVGTTTVVATGTVSGFGDDGVNVVSDVNTTDVLVDVHDVEAAHAGIWVDNLGSGDTMVRSSGTVNSVSTGVFVRTTAASQSALIEAVDVISETTGITLIHEGAGLASVNATGNVVGTLGTGIGISAGKGATDVRVTAVNATGGNFGIRTLNEGTGETFIAATGLVVGGGAGPTNYGILAQNREGLTTDLFLRAAEVQATSHGIVAESDGLGTMTVIADKVTSQTRTAVRVYALEAVSAVNVAIGEATGGTTGVEVFNMASGFASIEATGIVTGLGEAGISVEAGVNSTDIDLRANAVNGQTAGIRTTHFGTGDTNIVATGSVAAATGFGIRAVTGTNAANISITAVDVAGTYGIGSTSDGTGSTSIVSTGDVVGFAGDAVRLENNSTATDALVDVHNAEGSLFGIQVNNDGTGATTVRASGTVTGEVFAGIAVKTGTSAQDVVVDAVDVTGLSGVTVTNFGLGSASVSATGTVTGEAGNGAGIAIVGGTGSTDIRVSAVSVQGGADGITTNNDGSGETFIATTGLVSGGTSGIYARNGAGGTDLTVRASAVQSGGEGIGVENFGSGKTTVIAGTATGGNGAGIRTYAGANAGDITVEAGTASGGFHGIFSRNEGVGATSIIATGSVTGGTYGIRTYNDTGTTGLTIRAADVQSGSFGITAGNFGSGETTVIATGAVAGVTDVGIYAIAGPDAGDITVEAASVSGGSGGLRTISEGIGATSITTTGLVSGSDYGILAENGQTATDMTIRAVDVQAVGNAITAENLGSGETMIATTGTVTSQDAVGILVFAGGNSGDITVESGNASGGLSGISAINFGLGDTRITVNGVAQGSTNGVEAFSDGNQRVVIINSGTVRNASGLGSARAISASGGLVGIGNDGNLLGTVEIAGDSSFLLNSGNWRSTGGTSNFATLDDTLFNATTGTLLGGVLAATAESSVWQGLEHFQNSGVLRLQDGGVGDIIQTSAATVFANGSTLTVDIAGATGADSFRTTGAVAIEAGSRLQAVAAQPLVLHGKHVVVQADGGLTGQFAFEDQLLTAFAGLRDGYTATTAFLEFAQLKALASAGLTPNQKAAAAGADSLPDGNPVKDALLLLPTDAAAQAAFDQLSGEIHPSARNAMVEDSRLVRNAVLDHLADGETGGALWGRLFSTSGVSDGDYNAAELDRDTKGGVIGLDRSVGPVTIGVAAGWTDTKLRVDRRDSSGSIEGLHGMVYAGARFGGFGLRGGVGYARTSTETTRRIAFQGLSASPTADYDGSVLQGFVEAGYRVPLGGGHVEPFVGLTAIRAKTDAFTEASGPAALSGAAISEKTMASTLGARFETSRAGPFSLRGTVGWRHGWGDLEPVGRHAFAGGTPFTVLGTAGSGDAGVFNAEARFRLSSSATLSVGYDGVLGSGTADHAITGGLKIVF